MREKVKNGVKQDKGIMVATVATDWLNEFRVLKQSQEYVCM